MSNAHERAIEQARQLRLVIEECERILSIEGHPKTNEAQKWLDRLAGVDQDLFGYPHIAPHLTPPRDRSQVPSGNYALRTQAVEEGWGS